MRVLAFGPAAGHREARFGSSGFTVTPLARSVSSAVFVTLEAGGVIGRHDALGDQLLCVLSGSGTASGADRVGRSVAAGDAVLWSAGESHETRTEHGLTAVIVEGRDITVLLGRNAGS